MFRSVECSLLWAEGFSCILDVLNGSLGVSKLQFLTGQWRTSTAGPAAKKLRIMIRFHQVSGSGSKRAKITHKNIKK
jgi:hypothetical protein